MSAIQASLLAGAAALTLATASQAADIYSGKGGYKDGPITEAPADYTISVNGGLTTDYVFRGFSQTDNDPGIFVGADFTYQWFYAGIWAASVDNVTSDGELEVDLYAGIKKSVGGLDFDVGVIYYAYPSNSADVDLEYVEVKAAIGGKIADVVSLTGTVFYSPDFYAETGEVWTLEAKASAPLPIFDLSLSGTVGTVIGDDDEFEDVFGVDEYVYWNVGLSKTFKDHFTLDVRYWDTDVDTSLSDERVVGTISFSY